jgi:hypothetical protein
MHDLAREESPTLDVYNGTIGATRGPMGRLADLRASVADD